MKTKPPGGYTVTHLTHTVGRDMPDFIQPDVEPPPEPAEIPADFSWLRRTLILVLRQILSKLEGKEHV